MDREQKYELYGLLNALCEKKITDEQFIRLETWLQSEPEAREVYADFMSVWSNLMYFQASLYSKKRDGVAPCLEMLSDPNNLTDSAIWAALARAENEAPAIESKQQKVPPTIIQNVERPNIEYKISKGTIFSIITASAAMIFLFLFARFVPPKSSIEVATLTDSINAQWADMNVSFQNGARLDTSGSFLLKEGLVELLFDNQAKVTVEAPAEFRFLAKDQMMLRYGRLYAIVPDEAIGFTVNTPSARIIDLGTEFGVRTDVNADTSLYVTRGRTTLMAGEKSPKNSLEVGAGVAKMVSGDTLSINDIAFQQGLFVRAIDSKSNLVWKGQKKIILADIIGGGNGLGTGKIETGIDPVSGKPSSERLGVRKAENDYRSVASNPFIDGVFIPDGRTRQIVSSQGHWFRECPQTSGLTCDTLVNVVRNLSSDVTEDKNAPNLPAQLLLMHANMGITFDLQAIRSLLPGVGIVRFQSQFGIRKWAMRPDASNADFWVLVDGELKFKKEHVTIQELHSVDIKLSENGRFLTLIMTEGNDPDERIWDDLLLRPIDSDWGMFVEPVLVLGSKQSN